MKEYCPYFQFIFLFIFLQPKTRGDLFLLLLHFPPCSQILARSQVSGVSRRLRLLVPRVTLWSILDLRSIWMCLCRRQASSLARFVWCLSHLRWILVFGEKLVFLARLEPQRRLGFCSIVWFVCYVLSESARGCQCGYISLWYNIHCIFYIWLEGDVMFLFALFTFSLFSLSLFSVNRSFIYSGQKKREGKK